MITRFCKILFGALLCGVAVLAIWQILSQSILSDVKHWIVSGEVEHISFLGGKYDVSGRLLACVVVFLPIAFAVSGVWLLLSAFRRKNNDSAA